MTVSVSYSIVCKKSRYDIQKKQQARNSTHISTQKTWKKISQIFKENKYPITGPDPEEPHLQILIHRCHAFTDPYSKVPHLLSEPVPQVPHLQILIHKYHTIKDPDPQVPSPWDPLIHKCHHFTGPDPQVPHPHSPWSTCAPPSQSLSTQCHNFTDYNPQVPRPPRPFSTSATSF